MSEMNDELKEKYQKDAKAHADFLCEKVFKPAFIMAFIHGVKHGREDLRDEMITVYRKSSGDKNET